MINVPMNQTGRADKCSGENYWAPRSSTRVRRSGSIWLSVEDDDDWHEVEDAKITFRPDPWTIYTQEEPRPVSD